MFKQIKKISSLLLPIGFLLLAACSSGNAPSENKTRVALSLSLEETQGKTSVSQNKAADSGVASVSVRVEVGPEPTVLLQEILNLESSENHVLSLEAVPVGPARTFIVEAFSGLDATGDLIFQGTTTVDIAPGTTVSLAINLTRVGPTPDPTPDPTPTPGPVFGSMTLSPDTALVSLGDSVTLTVTGDDISRAILEWRILPPSDETVPLGNFSVDGTVAVYTAPANFPSATEVDILVVNTADDSLFASATISLQNPPFSIAPKDVILNQNESQLFSLSGIATSNVTWSVNGVSGGDTLLGLLDAAGNYNAPMALPIDTSVTALGVPIPIAIEATATVPVEANTIDIASVKVTTGKDMEFDSNVQVSPPETGSTQTSSLSAGQRGITFSNGKGTAVWTRQHLFGEVSRLASVFSETEDGETWTAPKSILGIPKDLQGEAAVTSASDGTIYATFLDCGTGGCGIDGREVRFAKKSPSETTFSEIDLTQFGQRPKSPSVVVSPAGVVFVAWATDRGVAASNYDIHLQRFEFAADGTVSSRRGVFVTESSAAETEPSLSISEEGVLYLAWRQAGAIMATRSTDRGASFDVPVRVNDVGEGFGSGRRPSVAAGPKGTVYIAWEKDCGEVCSVVAFDKGTVVDSKLNFGADQSFPPFALDSDSESQTAPSLAWDHARGIYLAYWEQYVFFNFSGSRTGIFLAKSVDGGTIFGPSVPIDDADDNRFKANPSIAVDAAGRVFASWTDIRGGQAPNSIWFAKGANAVAK